MVKFPAPRSNDCWVDTRWEAKDPGKRSKLPWFYCTGVTQSLVKMMKGTLWWTNILPWKITIFNGKILYKWPFSIAMSAITRGYSKSEVLPLVSDLWWGPRPLVNAFPRQLGLVIFCPCFKGDGRSHNFVEPQDATGLFQHKAQSHFISKFSRGWKW